MNNRNQSNWDEDYQYNNRNSDRNQDYNNSSSRYGSGRRRFENLEEYADSDRQNRAGRYGQSDYENRNQFGNRDSDYYGRSSSGSRFSLGRGESRDSEDSYDTEQKDRSRRYGRIDDDYYDSSRYGSSRPGSSGRGWFGGYEDTRND